MNNIEKILYKEIIIKLIIKSLYMYFFKRNTFNFIKIKLILPLILSILFFCNITHSEEIFIGFIESLEGQAKKNINENLKRLSEYDQIFTNENIIISPNSSINISFVDNSTLTLYGDSEFLVKEFDNISDLARINYFFIQVIMLVLRVFVFLLPSFLTSKLVSPVNKPAGFYGAALL